MEIWRASRIPASICTSAVPTPIFLSPFFSSSTFEWKDILGLLSCPEGFSEGPAGHASRSCFAFSGTHAGPPAGGTPVSDDEAADEDDPDWDVLAGVSAA